MIMMMMKMMVVLVGWLPYWLAGRSYGELPRLEAGEKDKGGIKRDKEGEKDKEGVPAGKSSPFSS